MKLSFAIIAFLALLGVASAHLYSDSVYETEFTAFAQKFEKTYSVEELFTRFHIFRSNMDAVKTMSEEDNTFTVAMNKFGDISHDEFKATFLGLKLTENRVKNYAAATDATDAPDSLDWVAAGAVTGVKDQGQCGSCWAFSATGSIEGANFLSSGSLVSVSEQQLVDCSSSYGNLGCNGGLMDGAFEYVETTDLCTETDYPYQAANGLCKASSCTGVSSVSSYVDVKEGDETDLMTAIQVNPVSIAIDASGMAFQFYSGGVFAKTCGEQLDHGVLLVGYGTDAGQDYWNIKNSWGATWGEAGYIRFIRDQNQCGLSDSASYPIA